MEYSSELSTFKSDSLIRMINQFKRVNSLKTTADQDFNQDLPNYVEAATYHSNGTLTRLSLRNRDCHIFTQRRNLQELSLLVNHFFENIKWKLFETFPNLVKLEIRSVKYDKRRPEKYDALSVFEGGESLKSLKMEVISTDCIQKLGRCFPQLEELDLSGSRLIWIGPNGFSNFPNLKKLNLSHCSVEIIDPRAFNNLNNLNELDISSNYTLTAFKMTSSVVPRVIKARYCKDLAIVKILDSDLSSSSSIEKLHLSSGILGTELECSARLCASITELIISPTPGISFDSFSSLERLNLTIDDHYDVKPGQLASLISLKNLHFKCNASRELGL
jgi:Leucine-rich repeat (LRR) protein